MSTNDLQKLRECPFCGGEVYLKQHNRYTVHNWHIKHVDANAVCLINQHTPHYLTADKAEEAWNARWERTCRPVERFSDDGPWPRLICSECGEPLKWYDTVNDHGDDSVDLLPFCAGCGAKVVE